VESKPTSDNKPELYEVAKLRLDNQNPRLPAEARALSQADLLTYMEEHFDLLPIARSMSDNGYFDEEPVIIIPQEHEPGFFVTVEGNRRLAALKFLTDPIFRAKSAYKEQYLELYNTAVENLLRIPAVKYDSRKETTAMLGFRHIAGIKKWSAFSKAEFVHNFANDNKSMTLSDISRELGDNLSSIKRSYATYCIYLQANGLGIDTSNVAEDFSVFYTALGRVAVQDFIGVRIAECENQKSENPVPKTNYEQLEELITWVHGKKRIIQDSRELKKLAAVLESKEALAHLRAGGTLNDAFSLTSGENEAIINSINKASFHIEESLRYLHRHKDDTNVRSALLRCAQSLRQAMSYFPDLETELTDSAD
jgi:hypothetical protein